MSYTDKTLQWGSIRTNLLFIALVLLSVLFFGGIGVGFSQKLFVENSPEFLRWVQFSISFGLFLMPPLLLASIASNEPAKFLGLRKPQPFRKVSLWIALVLIAFGAFFAIDTLAYLNDALIPRNGWALGLREQEANNAEMVKSLLSNMSLATFAANAVVMVLVPALGEELFFRGILMKLFQRHYNHRTAIFISAFFFALAHQQPISFLPIFFMGILFGYVSVWTKSLWTPILLHAINNGFALLTSYANDGVLETSNSIAGTFGSFAGILSLFIGVFWLKRTHLHLQQ
jgi:membrane protease YdiL (CAAX protease family)